jgi:hypothetical protein
VAFRFDHSDRCCCGVSVRDFESRHPDAEEIRFFARESNRIVRRKTMA